MIVNSRFIVFAKQVCTQAYQCKPWLCRLSGGLVWGMVPEAANVYIRIDPDHVVQLLLSASLKEFFSRPPPLARKNTEQTLARPSTIAPFETWLS